MKSAATIALVVLFALPLAAQDRNTFTVWIGEADIEGENDFGGGGFETEFEEGRSYGISANRFFGKYVSVEGSMFAVRSDAALVFEQSAVLDLGKLNLTMFTLGAQFHVLPGRRFDPYVGAGGAYIVGDDFLTRDLDNAGVGRIEIDNELAYYLNAGISFQITSGFGVVVDARYIPYETSTRSAATGVEQELEISPRIVSAGVRLRF